MALLHHERTWPLLSPSLKGSFPYYICTTNWPLLSPAPKSSFPYYICTTNWPLLSPSLKGSFPYYTCATNWSLLSPAPKSSFPYYFCTANWPLLSPAPTSSFPHYICTTNWPLPQRVARAPDKSHSRLHFAHSTRTISAEGCAHTGQIALSPAFRALDARDLRRRLRAHRQNRTLTCISHTRHARSPQRVARAWDKSHSRLHFAHSTRTISAEGCIFA